MPQAETFHMKAKDLPERIRIRVVAHGMGWQCFRIWCAIPFLWIGTRLAGISFSMSISRKVEYARIH